MSAVQYFHDQLCRLQIIDPKDPVVQQMLNRALKIEEERIMAAHADGFTDAYGFPEKRTAQEYIDDQKKLK